MPDLDSAIDELRRFGSTAPSQEPDLDRIAGRVRTRRRRRRVALVGVVCSILALAAVVVIDPGSKDPTLVETAGDPEEVTPDPDPAVLPEGSLVSGRVGLAQVSPQSVTLVHDQPTAIAFNVGNRTLVAQGADVVEGVGSLTPMGPILVLDGDQVREIPPADGEQLRLLDALVFEGRPTALVAVRTGTTPEDTTEELILLDTESGERTSLGEVGGWESGVFHARVTGSHIATLLSAEASTFVVVRSLDGEVEWQLPDAYVDRRVSITVLGDDLLVLQPGFEGDDLAPTVTIERFDLATGATKGSTSLGLDLEPGLEIGSGFCGHAESDSGRLYCDRSDGPPIEISLGTGATRSVAGFESGLVTLPRNTVAQTIPTGGGEPIEALIRFAQARTAESAAAVPFGTPLRIGLGAELLRDLDSTSQTDPRAWTLELDGRWAAQGPISALELLRDSATLSLTRDRPASCGSTISPPVPPELASLTRLTLSPTGGDSCLTWFAVDVYLNGTGSIVAVTVELYEP